MASKTPKPKFMILGKSKWVHVVRTAVYDRKHSECQQVRKYNVGDKIDYKAKGMSVEAATALDPCPHCDTAQVLKGQETPEQRKARAKDQADATRQKIVDSKKTAGQRKKEEKAKAKKVDKPAKQKAGKAAGKRVGPRSTGGDTQGKADALVAFAKEHGWDAAPLEVKGEPGILVQAMRGEEVIRCWFVDGKYDTARHATLTVGTWTGKLRGVHGCRKQMAGEGRDRPHANPGAGRSVARKKSNDEVIPEDESPEDAKRRVPFSTDDDVMVIIDAIKGKRIKWRNGQSHSVEEAWLPSEVRPKRGTREAKRDVISITEHPKTNKRILQFLTVLSVTEDGEQYGPERSVYLEKIIRVVG